MSGAKPMAETFALPLSHAPGSRLLLDARRSVVVRFDDEHDASAAALAINVHDELLAALKDVDSCWSEMFPDGPEGKNPIFEVADEHKRLWHGIRAAIAKSEASS